MVTAVGINVCISKGVKAQQDWSMDHFLELFIRKQFETYRRLAVWNLQKICKSYRKRLPNSLYPAALTVYNLSCVLSFCVNIILCPILLKLSYIHHGPLLLNTLCVSPKKKAIPLKIHSRVSSLTNLTSTRDLCLIYHLYFSFVSSPTQQCPLQPVFPPVQGTIKDHIFLIL